METLLGILLFLLIVGLVVLVIAGYYLWENSGTTRAQPQSRPQASSSARAPQVPASPRSRPTRAASVQRMRYRTRDGADYFRFSFEEQGNGQWRAYIVDQPSYRGRDSDAHTTHRLSDGARKYICWTDPLRTLDQAKQVALMWAEATQTYVRTGTRF